MNAGDRENLLARFLLHSPGSGDEHYEAVEEVDEIVRRDQDEALTIIQQLLARAADDEQFGYIAAGPLEDLVRAASCDFFQKIEDAARLDPLLAEALAGVWVGEEVPIEIRERLASFIKKGRA